MNSKLPFSEIAEVVMGQSPTKENVNSESNGFPLLNGPTEFTARYPTPVQFTTVGKKFSQPGDILFCVRGSTTGRMNYSDQKYAIGRGIAAIRGKNGYPTPYVRAVIEQNLERLLAAATGSTFPNVGRDLLLNFEVEVISPERATLANDLIVSLEDKIESNRQTNQTLEQIAQALFKNWFVDFEPVKAKIETLAAGGSAEDAELAAMSLISAKTIDELNSLKDSNSEAFNKLAQIAALFPAAMQDSELGEIPEGWEVKGLGEFTSTFDYVANGSFAALKANVELFDQPNDVLYVRTTDFNKGFKSELKYTDKSSYQFLAKSKLFGHETIISNVGDVGTVFRAPSWFDMPMTLGSNAMGIVAEGANSYIYYLFKSPLGQHLLDGITSGSAQMKFNKTSFRKLRVVLPNSVLLIKFEEFEASLWTKHASNQKESLHLENLRDTLLPKLLSGEIDLSSEVVE